MVALLRGVNVGGNRKVPMPQLCALAKNLGLTDVNSYLNSGNLIFNAGKIKPDQVTTLLEEGIQEEFGFFVDVMVRTSSQWIKYAKKSSFPDAEQNRPKFLHLGLFKEKCPKNTPEILAERALFGEKISLAGAAEIWVDYQGGAGKSKITAPFMDRVGGSPVTLRNWVTVSTIAQILT